MDTQIAVILLNYKTPEMTIDCLASIEGGIEDGVLVLVVDNNSGDGSCEKIKDSINQKNWGGWCRLIPSEVNGGFAAGNTTSVFAQLKQRPTSYSIATRLFVQASSVRFMRL